MVDLSSGLGVLACQRNLAQKCEANQDLKCSDDYRISIVLDATSGDLCAVMKRLWLRG